MSGRHPIPSDFPPHLQLTITPPPSPSTPSVNMLLLLHGLGDTKTPFTNLGKQLSLSETTCIALQAPTPLPFELGGFHWGDDIVFDQSSGQMNSDTGFSRTTKIVKQDIIRDGLMEKCGYESRDIMLFGFGQGAMAAIAAALSMSEELGGIISIGGPVPASTGTAKSRTPVLVLGGSSNTSITRTTLINLRAAFDFVEYHKWDKSGDGMPGSREEMLPIMRFLARRLRSRKGVPEGSVELG